MPCNKKNAITNKRIKIYSFYQIFFSKTTYTNYLIAKDYVASIDTSTKEGKEKMSELSGFKKNNSLLDFIDNLFHFFAIISIKSFKYLISKLKKYTQSLVAYYQNNQYKIKAKSIKSTTKKIIDTISIDKKCTIEKTGQIKQDVGFVEIAIWINSNTEKNKRTFIFDYNNLFNFYGPQDKYFVVKKVIVITIENINMPNCYTYNKPYYYYEL